MGRMKEWIRYAALMMAIAATMPPLSAQVKYEKETRIEEEEVPERARQFIARIAPTKNENWYREQNLKGVAIEVKLKKEGDRYSIKFTEEGEILDVEKEINWKQIPAEPREEIEEELEEMFDRYRIEKIQVQYRGSAQDLITYIQTGKQRKVKKSMQYEIVVNGKRKGKYHLYEATFDREGDDESLERILTRRTDNMEF